MSPPSRRFRALPIAGVVLLGGVAAVGFALRRGLSAADRTIERHRGLLVAERDRIAKVPRGRPAVLEPAREGNAADVLEEFLAAAERIPKAERQRLDVSTDQFPAAAAALLETHPEVIAAIEPILFVRSDPPPLVVSAKGGEDIRRFGPGTWLGHAGARGPRALHVALLGVACGNEIARRGSPVHRMWGAVIEEAAVRRAAEALARGGVDRDEARDVGRALDALDAARPSWTETLDAGRACTRALFVESDGEPWETIPVGRASGWSGYLPPAVRRRLWPVKVRRAEALEAWDAGEERMRAALAGAGEVGRDTLARCEAAGTSPDPFVTASLRNYPHLVRGETNVRARLRAVRVALAVAEGTARKGSPPVSLEELVPGVLPAVPLDPWDGRPLRYAVGRVSSVGADTAGAPPAVADGWDDLSAVVPALR